jgi:hypothetical protein
MTIATGAAASPARLTRIALAVVSAAMVPVGPWAAATPAANATGTTVTVSYNDQTQSYQLAPVTIRRSAGEAFTLANTMRSAENRQTVYVSITNGTGKVSMDGAACERTSSCKVLDLYNGSATGTVTVIEPGSFTITRVLRSYVGAEDPPITVGTLTIRGAAPVERSITITGSRTTVAGKPGNLIDGRTEGLGGNANVRVFFRFPGETSYTESSARPPVASDGTFEWQRKTGKKLYVFVTSMNGEIQSNRVIIAAN